MHMGSHLHGHVTTSPCLVAVDVFFPEHLRGLVSQGNPIGKHCILVSSSTHSFNKHSRNIKRLLCIGIDALTCVCLGDFNEIT